MFWRENEVMAERKRVAAARAGDRTAFDALMAAHQARLRAFLARRVGDGAADDVAQETLLAAWEALPRLDLKARFRTWLFSIALHKAADYHRSQGRRAHREVPLDSVPLERAFAQAPETTRVENRAVVADLLSRLSDDQRRIMELYYFDELTLPEIAITLNRNLNAVKYHFYRAHTVAAQQKESAPAALPAPRKVTRPLCLA